MLEMKQMNHTTWKAAVLSFSFTILWTTRLNNLSPNLVGVFKRHRRTSSGSQVLHTATGLDSYFSRPISEREIDSPVDGGATWDWSNLICLLYRDSSALGCTLSSYILSLRSTKQYEMHCTAESPCNSITLLHFILSIILRVTCLLIIQFVVLGLPTVQKESFFF